jgi:transcriptional regulator with XRE-family HTH domain
MSETASAATASFGYWVRRRRLALDLTQADLARAVSCATITIAKIERDERRPSRQMAALLADHLAIPPDERARFLAAALGEVAVDQPADLLHVHKLAAQVEGELARGIDLLTTSMRDVLPRHRSMRAVLAQSWDYLAQDEQVVFRGLSIFEGGFRLEAAQAVVAAPLTVLAALVEKAMLQLASGGRYRVHALLRQLGAEHLAAAPPEMATCRDRHAAYFLSFLAERRTALGGHEQMIALREIQEEMDNIRAAWAHAAAQGSLLALRDALPALSRFLWMRGRYAEGEQMARQALEGSAAAALTAEEQAVNIALTAYAAQFAGAVGAYDRALPAAQSALDAALHTGDAAAHCHYVLGIVQACGGPTGLCWDWCLCFSACFSAPGNRRADRA